ncbi:Rieske (2Fe-2S) protein [Kocuria rosea]|uniref:Rieske (2Fe-2S) protein n=1 Tax=Kocuria rosea TaxID=1275 RepID=UPI00203F5843|nr:Rieske (2Fe-2S) protein [Kocuria rosea]MCM3687268.1 Rieske (2Fe-2S) protein [Kocuria rosea]
MTAPEPDHPVPCGPRRRSVLGAAGLAAGAAAALTACGSSDEAPAAGPGSPVDLGPVEDLPVGSAVKVDRDGVQAVVGRPAPDTVVAFSPVCPHQGCMVAPREKRYVCPCHASEFDLTTGDVVSGPARSGLEPYPVAVTGGRIVLG